MAAIFSHNDSFEWTTRDRICSDLSLKNDKKLLLEKYRLALAKKAKVN